MLRDSPMHDPLGAESQTHGDCLLRRSMVSQGDRVVPLDLLCMLAKTMYAGHAVHGVEVYLHSEGGLGNGGKGHDKGNDHCGEGYMPSKRLGPLWSIIAASCAGDLEHISEEPCAFCL